MICGKCKTEFDGPNYGVVREGSLIDLCSRRCRAEFISTPDAGARKEPKPVARSRNAGKGVVVDRRLSPSEIKRRNRPKERDVSASIASFLDGRRTWNTRTQSGKIKTASGHVMQLCRRGTPDRIAAEGLHVWIEVKRPGEDASTEQAKVIEVLKSNGSLAFVIDDPRDLATIFEGLKRSAREIDAVNGIVREIQRQIDQEIQQRKETEK